MTTKGVAHPGSRRAEEEMVDCRPERGWHSPISRAQPRSPAYVFLVLFILVYCARPQDWIPGLSAFPLAKITGFLAVAAFGLSVVSAGRGVLRLPREMLYLILLLGQMSLAAVFSPVWRGGAVLVVLDVSKIVLITLAIVTVANTPRRLGRLLLVQVLSVTAIALASIAKSSLVAGRLTSMVSGVYGNPNDLALIAALAFPFCVAFFLETHGILRRLFWIFAMLVIVWAILLTYSRGGLLALLTAACMCVWEFGVKGKRPSLLFLTAIVGLGIILLATPSRYGERVITIFKQGEDPTGSARARRGLLVRSLKVTAEHPLLGIGPGNFQVLSGNWQETHNAYTQMSSEAGVLALILYLAILRRSFVSIREAKRYTNGKTELLLAGGLRTSLAAFVVGSCFLSVGYNPTPYFLVGYAGGLRRFTEGSTTPHVEPGHSAQEESFPQMPEEQERKRLSLS